MYLNMNTWTTILTKMKTVNYFASIMKTGETEQLDLKSISNSMLLWFTNTECYVLFVEYTKVNKNNLKA